MDEKEARWVLVLESKYPDIAPNIYVCSICERISCTQPDICPECHSKMKNIKEADDET